MIEEERTVVETLAHQTEFINSEAPFTGLVAGFGAGKSLAGTYKTVKKKLSYPGIDVAYYLPTIPLIKAIAFKNFRNVLSEWGVPYTLHETDKEFSTPYGKIILRSMENPETIIGYEVGYSLIDEADILPHKKMALAFAKIIGRNRSTIPNGDANSTDAVSTPEGFKFMHEFFVKKASERKVLVRANSHDNPFLPQSYFDNLYETYTAEQLSAYLKGDFVNLNSGNVYYRFSRKDNHSAREVRPGDILHIGMDFNVTNMNAVVNVIDGNIATAVDEFVGLYDTSQIAEAIKERYRGFRVVVYPDASGAAKSTSGESDITILKKAGFMIKAPKKNPFVRDRVNAVNLAIKDNNGKTTFFVNTFKCPSLTEAFEQMPYKNGEPDKTSGFDHITEAEGYFLNQFRELHKFTSISV